VPGVVNVTGSQFGTVPFATVFVPPLPATVVQVLFE
jgi:hypothetical protein